ncbi:MAG: LacI family DNA-binding transcriptional regulator [Lunatimonas sp.]|uniref:LacI family DNA-binding transcriptional regulator n=1 Tax=Lunatimonas sp. TaxID=2060141 RepID=UPI00263AFDB3|nr:LacI family DNA-binding transcriptional regulator [Lunatimonas sp.]MCC5935718.1 LacI family DNA-binding transcriptional regulator [Lunatimonas sp.]
MKSKRVLSGVKEIARRANVSIATVDRVLHNRSGVSPKTKKKIEAIIKELNYRPNILASRLASGKVFHIAVIIPKRSERTDFWDAPLKGIERAQEEIKQYGVTVDTFLFDLQDRSTFQQGVEKIKEKNYDGVLIAPSFVEEAVPFLKYCKEKGMPFVFIDSNIENQPSLSYIGPPLLQSGFLGARLCDFGLGKSRKILLVHITKQPNSYNYAQIEKGFRSYFEQSDDPYDLIRLDIEHADQESVEISLKRAMMHHPAVEAIFVTNSRVFSVAKFLEDEGITHLHLVGYDFVLQNQEYLRKGVIDFLICHKPEDQGYKGLMNLYRHLSLKLPVDPVYYMPIDIVTKENQEYYR